MGAYYEDDTVQLYLGDMREVLPALEVTADLIVADPPYSETSLAWDRWPDGWPQLAATVTSSMWCFGSMRMFLDRALQNQPYNPDSVGYIVVGDCHRLLLATRCVRVDENAVISLTPEFFTPPELSDWGVALHEAAVRLGLADHPAPAWLAVHNYR